MAVGPNGVRICDPRSIPSPQIMERLRTSVARALRTLLRKLIRCTPGDGAAFAPRGQALYSPSEGAAQTLHMRTARPANRLPPKYTNTHRAGSSSIKGHFGEDDEDGKAPQPAQDCPRACRRRATQREGPSFDKGSLRFGIGEGRSVDAQHMLIGFVYNVIGHVYKRA